MDECIRCIIVEDFEPLNNVYFNILNYEKDINVVGKALNSAQLFELLKNNTVDIVLLDIEMGSKMEGIDACKKISRDYPSIKVIMLTCHDEEETILSAFEAGAVDYILKTSSSTEILVAVRAAYKNSSSINSYVSYVIRKRMMEFSALKESLLCIMNTVSSLTASELDVLKLLVSGKKQREIAEIRCVELVTVKAHVNSILRKFNKERTSDIIKSIRTAGLQQFIENMRS